MRIPLDRGSTAPLYRQIGDWLRADIAAGRLAPGTRLPSTRALAEQLAVARITVVNAYTALEGDGLVTTVEGGGTFVAPEPPRIGGPTVEPPSWPLWQTALPATAAETAPPPGAVSGVVDFTGVGDPRLIPVSGLERSLREVLRRDGHRALEYGGLGLGYPPLRETIAGMLASQGIRTRADEILVTSGSQQALALTCQLLLRPGDLVVVEQPTYDHALGLFRSLGMQLVGVPVDHDGMVVDELEPLLQRRHPRLIYTIPNFSNPTGRCLSGSRRRRLLALARQYNVPVLEDDFAGDLRFDGRAQPAIKALDPDGHVIYVGTFSKMLAPGLRIGYLVASGPVLARLAHHKQAMDLTTSPLVQRVVEHHVTVGRYQAHLRRTTRLYRQRRDALVAGVRDLLPDVAVDPPRGGLFAWLQLPPGASAEAVAARGRAGGVVVAPGPRFHPDPREGDGHLRLNFATCTPEEIGRGLARLTGAL